jgi:hypothetical protein
MKNTRSLLAQHCIAKQAGFMPTYWSAISLSNDRTPEVTGVQEDLVA